jgi:hypothetical protein
LETPTQVSIRRCPCGHLWILLLVATLTYLPALFYPFFIDDYVYLERVQSLDGRGIWGLFNSPAMDHTADSVWWALSGVFPFYRPIALVTFAIDHHLWGLRAFGYHLTNLLLHLACVVLTWRLARRLFDAPGYALAAAIVFALHPVHKEAVGWISGRFDLLVCLCVLASMLSYLNWKEGSARGWAWGALCVLWFIAGLGCKETALILPVVLVGLELLQTRTGPGRLRRLIIMIAAFGSISLLYLAKRVALFGSPLGRLPPPYGLDYSAPSIALRGLARNCACYLFDLILCIPVDPIYTPPFWREHPELFVLALAVSLLLLVGAIWVGRSKALWMGLVWLVVFAAPSLITMPGERNVYLASVGLALVFAAVFRSLSTRGAVASSGELMSSKRRLKQTAYGVVGLWIVLCLVGQVTLGRLGASSEQVFHDLASTLPHPPRGARIYVVNQNPLMAVGFAQGVRLRYGRPDLSACALSISPTLSISSRDKVFRLNPDSIRLSREGGTFFTSFVETFHRFSEPSSNLPEAAHRAGLELLSPTPTYDHLTTLDFRFPYPLDDPRINILYWDNSEIHSLFDFIMRTDRAYLGPCKVEATGANP